MKKTTYAIIFLVINSSSYANFNNGVWIENNTIYYRGYLSYVHNSDVFRLYMENPEVDLIDINSKGGEATTGLNLGEFIFRNNLSVRVNSYCMSSCANYVFTAGKVKYINSNSIIAFHGGAMGETIMSDIVLENFTGTEKNNLIKNTRLYKENLVIRETEFFETLNINQEITMLGKDEKYQSYWESGYTGWHYSVGALNSLGVKNIKVDKKSSQKNPIKIKLFKLTESNIK